MLSLDEAQAPPVRLPTEPQIMEGGPAAEPEDRANVARTGIAHAQKALFGA